MKFFTVPGCDTLLSKSSVFIHYIISFAKDNIRSILISPGHVDTPFIRDDSEHSPNDWSTSINNPENLAKRVGGTPLARLTQPEDIANAYLFAATDDAAMITGSMITVDGGAAL